ncbi:hypothetical protein GCM10027199_67400 [Amycolatopsis magusensis]
MVVGDQDGPSRENRAPPVLAEAAARGREHTRRRCRLSYVDGDSASFPSQQMENRVKVRREPLTNRRCRPTGMSGGTANPARCVRHEPRTPNNPGKH